MYALVGLAASSVGLMTWLAKKKKEGNEKEGFSEIPLSPQTKQIFDDAGQNLIQDGAGAYSRIMGVINPYTNPNFVSNATVSNLGNVLQSATASVNRTEGKLGIVQNKDVLLPPIENTVTEYVRRCETVHTANSNAFDDPWFASHCGLCHDGGVNSQKDGQIGGLYMDPASIPITEYNARRAGKKYPDYQPSVGKCAPGKFSVTKEQAERIQKQIECEKKQNYDVEGCAQCVDDEKFHYIPRETAKSPITIVFSGSGLLQIDGESPIPLTDKAVEFTPKKPLKEGDVVSLKVKSDDVPKLAAYIYAKTVTGEYRMDIASLAYVDLETNAKPRFAGSASMNSESYNILRPGAGKKIMNIQLYIPYTYVESNEPEALQCGSAPFMTNATSASKIGNSPCFAKGAKAGNYSLECIQQVFTNAECGPAGNGYPTTLEKARTWAAKDTIGVLANKISNIASIAMTGYNENGQKVPLPQRHDAAQFCNGRSYLTVCDVYDTANGPLGADCLDYLWKEGARCTANGLGSPIRSDGSENADAISEAQKQGGVEKVKAYYDGIYRRAMNNGLLDADRENQVKQCFGTGFIRTTEKHVLKNLKTSLITNPSANQKTEFERINNEYPYGGNFSPVAVLGRYGMAPWGSGGNFSDPSAYWIWNTYGADKNAPVFQDRNTPGQDRNKPAFYYIYDNKTNSVIRARIDYMIDNIGDLYVNGDTIGLGHTGGWDGSWRATANSIGNQKFVSLKPGRNMIKFVANNFGGPAGFLMACFGPDGKLLFHTDGSWFFRDAYN